MAIKDKNNALKVSAIIFGLVTLFHLIRIITGATLAVGSWDAPIWVSVVGIIVPGFLAWWTWTASN